MSNARRERVTLLRDAAMRVVRSKGIWDLRSEPPFLCFESSELRLNYRGPQEFFGLPDISYNDLLSKRFPNSRRFGLDVYGTGHKTMNLEWDDDGEVEIVSFKRGAWEEVLLSLAEEC